MMGWQWHWLDHMQTICTSFQTDNHASTSLLKFLQAGCPSCHPTNSVKALKDVRIHYKALYNCPVYLLTYYLLHGHTHSCPTA